MKFPTPRERGTGVHPDAASGTGYACITGKIEFRGLQKWNALGNLLLQERNRDKYSLQISIY
jgi:hypothetical protein